jgi:hypothetical protein
VTTGDGTSPIDAADQFTYETTASPPVVTTIAPTSGPAAGGTMVTINGSHFTGATSVTFGGKPGSFTVVSDSEITAISPAGKSGSVNVLVHAAAGNSAKTHKFTYV